MGIEVEALFDQLRPILDGKSFGLWRESDVSTLLSLLDEYHKVQRKKHLCSLGNPPMNRLLEVGSGNEEELRGRKEGEEQNAVDVGHVMGEMDRSLTQLRHYLQQRVPYGFTCEPNNPPWLASAAACNGTRSDPRGEIRAPIFPVDAFLYLEEDVDELAERGCISREYCRTCGSNDIGLSEFITHSFSQDQLVFLSCCLLPALGDPSYRVTPGWRLQLRDEPLLPGTKPPFSCQHVVDVGSRLELVLLSCYFALQQQLLRVTHRVTGVELDDKYVAVQHDAINRFAANSETMQLEVLHGNSLEGAGAEVLRSADVVVLHNVFEYFSATSEEHLRSWRRLREIVARSGQLLICSPSLQETFAAFNEDDVRAMLHDDRSGDTPTASSAAGPRMNANGSSRKRLRDAQEGRESIPERWLQSWVREIDVEEVRDAFLALRQETDHCHDGNSSCSQATGESMERLRSVRVYVVN